MLEAAVPAVPNRVAVLLGITPKSKAFLRRRLVSRAGEPKDVGDLLAGVAAVEKVTDALPREHLLLLAAWITTRRTSTRHGRPCGTGYAGWYKYGMSELAGYPPQPNVRPTRRAYSRRYRVWAHVLLWTPIAITVVGVILGLGLFAAADADPTHSSSALGYFGIVVWGGLAVLSPVLLGSFIAGLVMLIRARS
ncbi:hypothetical protein [Streptosporangium sp. NPDC049046]|uniref:hypothetical protein n=1 Tax=Streptosporangium sp. NPDC049046 TaxID=3155031 RepID=UPI0034326D31